MDLQFFNTLTRKKETFIPISKKEIGLYTCGPTVYNYVHVGNLRTYIFEDVLKRTLLFNGFRVKHVMNITDVGHLTDDRDQGEDKMEKGSKREGKTAYEIAEFYTQKFKQDLQDLNILEPTIWCKATENINEQIALIEQLEKNGFTYKTIDGIYFDTSKLPDYGKLAGLKKNKLKAGARVEMGGKKNSTDFALWKFSSSQEKRQMEWPSAWGIGFPGWHIECSAMAAKYLGIPFDIHCGGIDHIPVHHTNEIAQTEGATQKLLANYWLHGEFLLINKEKMAKSGENFITLQTIVEKGFSPLAYRYFLLQTHYRQQLNFSWEALEAAQNGLNNLYKECQKNIEIILYKKNTTNNRNDYIDQKIEKIFIELIINNDLNTPSMISLLWSNLKYSDESPQKKYNLITEMDKILGLNLLSKAKDIYNQKKSFKKLELPEEIKKIITEREEARKNRDYKKSDQLREELNKYGYEVKDEKNGQQIISKK